MKALLYLSLPVILLCFWFNYADAQESDDKSRQLTEMAQKIREYYIFERVAQKLATKLESARDRGVFEHLSQQEFADSLSSFLVMHSDDRHFNVIYNPNHRQEPQDEKDLLRAADEINRRWNYGFEQVSRLAGNIGYIEYTGFPQGNKSARRILDATMNFVSNTNALIIDLRDNRGGDGRMVRLFLSYFFEEKVPLSESYTRHNKKTKKSSTWGKVKGLKYLHKPVYILVNNQTISAAEALAYELQCRIGATVIGETTYGAANPIKVFFIDNTYALFIPITQIRNTVTNTNWEHTGVPIDVPIESGNALTKAHVMALKKLLQNRIAMELTTDEVKKKMGALKMQLKP